MPPPPSRPRRASRPSAVAPSSPDRQHSAASGAAPDLHQNRVKQTRNVAESMLPPLAVSSATLRCRREKDAQTSQRPLYPSSKSKINWDKLEAEVKKEEKEEKLDGDAAVNKIFQTMYKDADEDTRRAMSKSFVESNGTVLSTNWKEVGSKTVEGSAPEGLEMKKWEI